MEKLYPLFMIIYFLSSCNSTSTHEKGVTATGMALNKMDKLEKMFNNDNWMKTIDEDTSYYNFSRNQSITRVYNYRMQKGDSVNTKLSEIKILNDSLQWQFNDTLPLFLASIDETKAEWINMKLAPQQADLIFEKENDKKIRVTSSNGKKYFLVKTLPLSTFLVRSRYDFLHGTRLAFSDTTFPEKNQ